MDSRVRYPSPIVRALPLRERPLHRVRHDAGACNLVELLAAIVGGSRQIEIACDLLTRLEALHNLYRVPVEELTAVPGLGPVGAARLKAALELGRRLVWADGEDRPQIRCPADAAQLLMPEMAHLEAEHFRVLYLNTRNRIIGSETLYVGSLNASHIRVGEVFRGAIRRNCAAIIVAHNHPSCDCSQSPEDVEITRLLVKAGDLLGIEVVDHLIIARQRFVSLRERRLGFQK